MIFKVFNASVNNFHAFVKKGIQGLFIGTFSFTPFSTVCRKSVINNFAAAIPVNFRRRTIFRSFLKKMFDFPVLHDIKVACNNMATRIISKFRFDTVSGSRIITFNV